MKRVTMLFAVFLFAFAAAAGDRLPQGMLAHISVKSLTTATANLDALMNASVKGTPAARQFQPGMLPLLLGLFSPIPVDAWDMNGEVHALLLTDSSRKPHPVVIVKTSGLDAFRKAMADGGITLEGQGAKLSGFIPKLNGTWYFADLGGGLVAGSISEAGRDMVAGIVAGGWGPRAPSAADLSAALDVKNLLGVFRAEYDAGMRDLRKQFESPELNGKDVPESAKPLVDALGRMMVRLVDTMDGEVPAMNLFGLDLFFGGERLKLAFSLSADAGSGVDALRAAYAGVQPKYALARAMPEETALLGAVSDLSKLPAGIMDFYVESLRDVAKQVMPGNADELAGLPRRFLDLGVGEYAAGSYLVEDTPVMAAYFTCAKPDGFLELMPRAVELWEEFMNGLFKAAGEGENISVAADYSSDAGKIGDVPYHRLGFRFDSAKADTSFLYETLLAAGPDGVTLVYGDVNEDDLANALENRKSAAGAFVDSESVRKSLADIERRQIKFMAMRPVPALVNLLISQAGMVGGDVEAVYDAVAGIEAGPGCFAVGTGASDKAMTAELTLPAGVIVDFIRNSKAIEAMVDALNAGGGAGRGDDGSRGETEDGESDAGGGE